MIVQNNFSERPTPLRREKTFDLNPNESIKDVKVRWLFLTENILNLHLQLFHLEFLSLLAYFFYFDAQLTMTEIPINFGEIMAGNSNRQIADPAGMGNNEIDDVTTSPEVMTSLQMFQQQRLGNFLLISH